jgi:alpha-tubulin suppressor-like RCC1 family protein
MVVAGGLHTLALSKTGKVYSWGCNDQKALGRAGEESEPHQVTDLDHILVVKIACGDSCSVALTDQGVYENYSRLTISLVEFMHGALFAERMEYLAFLRQSKLNLFLSWFLISKEL